MASIKDIYPEEMGVLVQHNTFEESFNFVFSITSYKLQLQIIPEEGISADIGGVRGGFVHSDHRGRWS